MSSERVRATVRLGFLEYLADNPWRIQVTSVWPLALAQCLFFTLLGRVAAGQSGGAFAFVGSLALVLALSTIGGVGGVPGAEKTAGTLYRLQLSGISPAGMFALRSLPWLANALFTWSLCLLLVAPLTGHTRLALSLIPALPLFALMALTSAAAGLVAASPAMGRRAEPLLTNGMMYLVITGSGLFIPAGSSPVIDTVGGLLPLRHGVLAVRRLLDGRPWAAEVAYEALIGLIWALLAVALYRRQAARARRLGTDDFS
ncbi:hypothetical protein LG634_19335 [Streptomyces bambusae]|uniref:ABC transporter permease n=1 Tax=Streptomyces bambusae TaxID=1550616 RepID=UPI001CFD2436|nr:ABC transporter permease [Streptomyces bambusae]MCB5166984.1 hypothetical protein [Streptomyces bambusae]